jgi:7,8-dihydropterin-6-yl-methyl-4-(beta-D-ribofuranosyl)aminobenzene 5'-phosphate synthase
MIKKLKMTILVDNKSDRDEYLSEHGFAVWIEADKKRILFDTGTTGNVLINNAGAQGIDISTADFLVLSHGHYDHTGGIKAVLKVNPAVKIICHPSVSIPRYSRQKDGEMKSVGITSETRVALKRVIDNVQWVSKPTELFEGAGITGEIDRTSSFEDTGGEFYLDNEGKRVDLIEDDLAMWFTTINGLVVLTGCCHSGIVNTINHIRKLKKGKIALHALIGGFHLCNASKSRISKSADFLKNEKIEFIVPAHCTGEAAFSLFRKEFKSAFQIGTVGTQFYLF